MLADVEPEPARDRRHRARSAAPGDEVAADGAGRGAGRGGGRRGSASMKIAEVSVKRPVFAIMMTAALIVLGAVSYESLGLDLMPKTDAPVVIGPGQPARRQRRGNRDADHQAHRGSGQHDQRHRRAARLLRPGQLARHHHLHARARHRVGDPGRPRQAGADRQPVPARHPAAADHQDGSRRAADLRLRRLRPARAEGADRDRREAGQAGARDASRTSARSATTASASARSSCCSTPIG